jgi:hypothetical protein
MRRSLALFALLVLAAAACGRADGPQGARSGIVGRVILHSCPVFAETSPCQRKGVRTTVTIEVDDQRIVQVPTGADGSFRIDLEPGQYVVTARPPASDPHLVSHPSAATVRRGAYARVAVFLVARLQEP